jgi:hypothetical protein
LVTHVTPASSKTAEHTQSNQEQKDWQHEIEPNPSTVVFAFVDSSWRAETVVVVVLLALSALLKKGAVWITHSIINQTSIALHLARTASHFGLISIP